MLNFWYLLVFALFKLGSTETSLEIEVSNHLRSLEDQVHFPINIHMSGLGLQLESLVTNFTNYQLDADEVIDAYVERVKENIDSVSMTDIGVETNCDENVDDNIKHIIDTNTEDIKSIILGGITRAQRIISDARNVYLVVQNRTIAVKLKVQHCLNLLDDSECLLEALTTIVLMERTVPKIISSAGQQHETQLALLEDDVIAGLEKVVVNVFDGLVEILDDFLVCSLKEEFYM